MSVIPASSSHIATPKCRFFFMGYVKRTHRVHIHLAVNFFDPKAVEIKPTESTGLNHKFITLWFLDGGNINEIKISIGILNECVFAILFYSVLSKLTISNEKYDHEYFC